MPYEIWIGGQSQGVFATEAEAVARAREVVRATPDAEPEIIDTETDRAAAPGGTKGDREDLAKKIGY